MANMSKSRFIAAASHDLLQPMHAARLFSTVLEQSISTEDRQTLQQLDRALYGAESMLSALLDIARLEGGTIQPKDNLIHCMIYSVTLSCSLNRSLLSGIFH